MYMYHVHVYVYVYVFVYVYVIKHLNRHCCVTMLWYVKVPHQFRFVQFPYPLRSGTNIMLPNPCIGCSLDPAL